MHLYLFLSAFNLVSKVYVLIFVFYRGRYKKEHPKADPHDLRTLNYFAEFITPGTEGMLDEDSNATIVSVRAK